MEQLTNNSIIWAAGENSGDYLASRVLPAVARISSESKDGRYRRRQNDPGRLGSLVSCQRTFRPRLFGSDPPSAANFKIRREMMRRTIQFRPAAYIGVDAPDFNLSIEEKVRASGIPVVHMVAPAVWLGVRREFTKSNVRWIICF